MVALKFADQPFILTKSINTNLQILPETYCMPTSTSTKQKCVLTKIHTSSDTISIMFTSLTDNHNKQYNIGICSNSLHQVGAEW